MESLSHKSWLFMCLRCSYTVSRHKKHKKTLFQKMIFKKRWKKILEFPILKSTRYPSFVSKRNRFSSFFDDFESPTPGQADIRQKSTHEAGLNRPFLCFQSLKFVSLWLRKLIWEPTERPNRCTKIELTTYWRAQEIALAAVVFPVLNCYFRKSNYTLAVGSVFR